MTLEEALVGLESHKAAEGLTNGMTWEKTLLDLLLQVMIVVVKELIHIRSMRNDQ